MSTAWRLMIGALLLAACGARPDPSPDLPVDAGPLAPVDAGPAPSWELALDLGAEVRPARVLAFDVAGLSTLGAVLAYTTADGATAVAFGTFTSRGAAAAPMRVLTRSATAEGGAAVAWDLATERYFVAWAEAASPGQNVRVTVLDRDGAPLVNASKPLLGRAGIISSLDLIPANDDVLIAGVLDGRTVFLQAVDARSAEATGSYDDSAYPSAEALSVRFDPPGSCSTGNPCRMLIRDRVLPRPSLGLFATTAVGPAVGTSTPVGSSPPRPRSYEIVGLSGVRDAGAFPRLASDGENIVSLSLKDTGELRLQVFTFGCRASQPLMGCTSSSNAVFTRDLSPGSLGGDDETRPVAVAVDARQIVYALASRGAGRRLVFGTRPNPDAVDLRSAPIAFSHPLAADLALDPQVVRLRSSWAAAWVEADALHLAGLGEAP